MKSISLFVLFWASINIHAVDNLRISDIRSLGMGGNGVTQSVLFNPALVALNTDKVLHLEYFNRYGVKELGTVGIGFVYPNPLLSAGVDISSFGYDQYRETLFRLSVGKQLNGRWRIGIGFQYKMLQTELWEEVPKQLSTDVGILFVPIDKLLIGMLIMNFLKRIKVISFILVPRLKINTRIYRILIKAICFSAKKRQVSLSLFFNSFSSKISWI